MKVRKGKARLFIYSTFHAQGKIQSALQNKKEYKNRTITMKTRLHEGR